MKRLASTVYERSFWKCDQLPAGVDEVGRGALAGPVVAAAVILDPDHIPPGLADSKILTSASRTQLAQDIKAYAIDWAVMSYDNLHIDSVNILQATYDAMHGAIDKIRTPDHLLIDGNRFRTHSISCTCIVGGDGKSVSIAAASILAKVHRDEYMRNEAHGLFPEYGFNHHVGYGTLMHRNAIRQHGSSTLHRRTFLRKILSEDDVRLF